MAHFAGLLLAARAVLTRSNWTGAAAGAAVGGVVVCALAVLSRLHPYCFPQDQTVPVFGVRGSATPSTPGTRSRPARRCVQQSRWRGAPTRATGPCGRCPPPPYPSAACLTYSRAGVLGIALGLIVVLALSRNRWTVALHVAVAAPATFLVIAAARRSPEVAFGTGTEGAGHVALLLA